MFGDQVCLGVIGEVVVQREDWSGNLGVVEGLEVLVGAALGQRHDAALGDGRVELGQIAELADDDVRLARIAAQVGEHFQGGVADVRLCQDDVHTAGAEQRQVGFDRGAAPVFDIGLDGAGSGDGLGGGAVKFGAEGEGDLLTDLAFAGQGGLGVIDAAVEHRRAQLVGAAVLHQQAQKAGAVGGGAGGRVVARVGQVDGAGIARLHRLEGDVDGLLLVVGLGLEAELVLLAPHQLGQTDGLLVGQFLAVGDDIDGAGAVLVVRPREAHQVGGSHDAGLGFGAAALLDQAVHRLDSGGGLLARNQNWYLDPGRMCLEAVFQRGDGHAGGVLAGFIAVGVGRALVADKAVAVVVHPLGHGGVHVQRAEQRDVREDLAKLLEQVALRFTQALDPHRAVQRQGDGVDRFFGLFLLGDADDLRLQIHVKIVVDLAVGDGAGKDGGDHLIALFHQRLDDAADRVVWTKTIENFGSADDLEILFPGDDGVEGVGLMLQAGNKNSFHNLSPQNRFGNPRSSGFHLDCSILHR